MYKPKAPMTEEGYLNSNLASLATDLNALIVLLRETEELQWLSPVASSDAEDAGIRSKGGHSDPTGDTATDPRRGALRSARKRSVEGIDRMARDVAGLRFSLSSALERWS